MVVAAKQVREQEIVQSPNLLDSPNLSFVGKTVSVLMIFGVLIEAFWMVLTSYMY